MNPSIKEIEKVIATYEKDNNYYAIIEYLKKIKTNNESECFVKSELGRALNNCGDYDEALTLLLWVDKKEEGTNTKTQYRIAYAYHHLDQYQQAFDYSNKGIILDKKYSHNYYIRGKSYEKIWYYTGAVSDAQKAFEDYQTYYQFDKKEKEALIWMAELYQKKLDEKFDKKIFESTKDILEKYKKGEEYTWQADRILEDIEAIKKTAEQPKEIISVPSYTPNWKTYTDELYGNPCQIKVDLSLQVLLPLKQFQEQVWISVTLNSANAQGLTVPDELTTLEQIENAFIQKLNIEHSIYLGYIQKDGCIDFYFNGNPIRHLERKLDQVMYHFQNYTFDWELNTTNVWLDYTELMIPEIAMH